MQRLLICVLGGSMAINSHASLIRTDAAAHWQNNHVVISSQLSDSEPRRALSAPPTARFLSPSHTVSAALLFDTNSAKLKTTAVLAPLAKTLSALPQQQIRVTGYTDNTGQKRYNQALSLKRAEAVIMALQNLAPQHRYIAVGKGDMEPISSNATAQGRAENRRVVVMFDEKK